MCESGHWRSGSAGSTSSASSAAVSAMRRVVLLHQAVELRLFGAVARVGGSTGGFPAVGVHRLRVLAQAGRGSV